METQEKINIEVQGNDLNIRHGNLPQLPDIFQYKGFQHRTTSAEGFVELVKTKSNKPNCVVFWDGDGDMTAIMDDTVYDRPQDTVSYSPAWTVQYKEWSDILTRGVTFEQKPFIDFLRTREPHELIGRDDLLMKVRKFTYVTRTEGDAIRDDNNNYSFALKVNNVEATVQIPATLFLDIELFADSDLLQRVELDLEVEIPRKEGEKLKFKLSCPTFERYKQAAIDGIVGKVKADLDGYLVVRS